ncbi:hypothetical protein D3C76_1034850 [compost metagenome]
MQQAALICYGNHGLGIVKTTGHHFSAFQRIDGYIDRRTLLIPDFLANIEHWSIIHLSFTNDDRSVDGDRIKHGADGSRGCIICRIFISPPDPAS